jgi:hypothetical protein
MTRRRQLRPAATCADVDDLLGILRDNLGKADAFITSAEELIERPGSIGEDDDNDNDDDLQRRRNHIEHMVEAAKLAVRAAVYTSGAIEEITQRRREH